MDIIGTMFDLERNYMKIYVISLFQCTERERERVIIFSLIGLVFN